MTTVMGICVKKQIWINKRYVHKIGAGGNHVVLSEANLKTHAVSDRCKVASSAEKAFSHPSYRIYFISSFIVLKA